MAGNRETAYAIVECFITSAVEYGRVVWTYGDLARAIGRTGQHRLLGGPLDEVRRLCEECGFPDIATVVVSKESLASGTLTPSPKALEKYGGWPSLRAEQAKVIQFDWSSARGR